MATIPGVRFDLTGASGSQGLLSPKSSWRVYVLPRGGYASQDSTGTLITFDSASVASRFAANDWIQPGVATGNIRQVSAVGGNSLSFSGDALTISENDRIYLIGSTEPTVSGGSATYTTPNTLIRQRDDDGASLYANSMVTSNSDGLVQFFSDPATYDCIIQDGNQANQGSIIDLPVGAVEGLSTEFAAIFGATVTINTALGVTGTATVDGWATFGATVTMNAAAGVTGTFTVGQTLTAHGALGTTGTALIGSTLTANAAFGATGHATFGATVTADSALGVTGWATFGASVTLDGALGVTGTAVIGQTLTASSDLLCQGELQIVEDRISFGAATAMATGDTTPSVADATLFTLSNGSSQTITDFDGHATGQVVIIQLGNGNTTFEHGSAKLQLQGKTDYNPPGSTVIGFIDVGGSVWWEMFRSED